MASKSNSVAASLAASTVTSMANGKSYDGMTPAQLIALLHQKDSQLSKKNAITVKMAERSSGTISLTGLNSRFPVSFYPKQVLDVCLGKTDEMIDLIESNTDAFRIAAFAAEYAGLAYQKTTNEKWTSDLGRVAAKKATWDKLYDAGKALAEKDTTLVATRNPVDEYMAARANYPVYFAERAARMEGTK